MNSEQLVHYAAIAMWLGSARMDGLHIQDEDAEARWDALDVKIRAMYRRDARSLLLQLGTIK